MYCAILLLHITHHFLYTPLFTLISAQLPKTDCHLAWWEMLRPCRVHKFSLVLIPSQMNQVYTLPSHLSYILILPSQIFVCLPGRFFTPAAGLMSFHSIYFSSLLILFSLACLVLPEVIFHEVPRPKFRKHFSFLPFVFYLPVSSVQWTVQVMVLFIIQFSLPSRNFVPLGLHIFIAMSVPRHLQNFTEDTVLCLL